MVAVDAVIIEVLSCNNASMRYIFKGEKPANLPAWAAQGGHHKARWTVLPAGTRDLLYC
jgi:hypothetical protein